MLDYFRPKFLLGLTATPERMDGKDVYALCDGNVAYQIHFIEAIIRGWLAPFNYYGVYDDTDYSKITWLGTRYDEEELLAAQLREERAAAVFRSWMQYKQTRTLGFCSSIRHADYLASYFREQGIRALSLHSRTSEMSRAEAIQALENGKLDIIFTVDLFNEGVDIPSVDTLLFVRLTESLTVITQQVGRGLRLAKGKTHCTIIDLIGNDRNAELKLSLFQLNPEDEERGRKTVNPAVITAAPPNCTINLEIGVINLLETMRAKRQPLKEKLLFAYLELKREWGRRPTYLELHLHGRAPIKAYRQEFRSCVCFLNWAGELTEHEQSEFIKAERWLQEVESTVMTKSYKMVLLLAMLERGRAHWRDPITPREAAPFFHRYLTEKAYRRKIDLSDRETARLAENYDEAKVAALIARMPMSKWSGTSKGCAAFQDGVFSLNPQAVPDSALVYEWTREICLYRLHEYFERKG